MHHKTLKALKGSIKKWEKIVAGTGIDDGIYNCPLCKLFYNHDCNGCPVSKATGMPYCAGSPYDDIFAYWGGDLEKDPKTKKYRYTKDQLKTAKAELKFLQSLLPEKKK